jgi:hypothetical protein
MPLGLIVRDSIYNLYPLSFWVENVLLCSIVFLLSLWFVSAEYFVCF